MTVGIGRPPTGHVVLKPVRAIPISPAVLHHNPRPRAVEPKSVVVPMRIHVVKLDIRRSRTGTHIKPMRRSPRRNYPVRINIRDRDMVRSPSDPHAISIEVSNLE